MIIERESLTECSAARWHLVPLGLLGCTVFGAILGPLGLLVPLGLLGCTGFWAVLGPLGLLVPLGLLGCTVFGAILEPSRGPRKPDCFILQTRAM